MKCARRVGSREKRDVLWARGCRIVFDISDLSNAGNDANVEVVQHLDLDTIDSIEGLAWGRSLRVCVALQTDHTVTHESIDVS